MLPKFEAIKLPPGYRLDWDGEYWSAKQSQEALVPGIVPAVVIMLLILVALFNGFRPMLICVLVIPFVMIGITAGLLMTRTPFGFIALLGAMSLSGMMIKNAVVLLDEVNGNLARGLAPYNAVVEAAVSRLSPVVNAAGTTVLGVLPMLQDVFWVAAGGHDLLRADRRVDADDGHGARPVCLVLWHPRAGRWGHRPAEPRSLSGGQRRKRIGQEP